MPKKVASVRLLGESSPSSRAMERWDTTAWTTPERAKPNTRGQRTSQNMLKASCSASRRRESSCIMVLRTFLLRYFEENTEFTHRFSLVSPGSCIEHDV